MSLIIIDLFDVNDYIKIIWGWIIIGLLMISFVVSLIIAIRHTKSADNKKLPRIKIILGSKGKKKKKCKLKVKVKFRHYKNYQ